MKAKFSAVPAVLGLTVATGALAQNSVPVNQPSNATVPAGQLHIIGVTKVIVRDAEASKAYYEKYFGLKEVGLWKGEGVYIEPIMGYDSGAKLALFQPLAEAPLKKPAASVALFYTPDFEKTVKKIEDAKLPIRRLPAAETDPYTIAIARDPSDNAIEILSRPDKKMRIGGSRLIVSDRAKAEEWYVKVFGAKPGQRFVTDRYDEVLMEFGSGPFLALFEPKYEAPLQKSKYGVVMINTTDFANVLKRIEEIGLGYRDIPNLPPGSRAIIAVDPAGNGLEIVRRP